MKTELSPFESGGLHNAVACSVSNTFRCMCIQRQGVDNLQVENADVEEMFMKRQN